MAFLFYAKTTTPYQPLSVLQILFTALHIPFKAFFYFVPLLLLSLLTSSSLILYFNTNITPTLQDLLSKLSLLLKDPKAPAFRNLLNEIGKDLESFASFTALVTPLYFLASLILTVATIYILSSAYTTQGASLSTKALVLKVVRRTYQTMVTSLYILLFGVGYLVISAVVVGTAFMVTDLNVSLNLTAMSTATSLTTLAVLLSLYLFTRGMMSVVMTVVEETWGIGALSWSVELFVGNKTRGTLLSLVLMSVRTAIYGALAMVIVYSPPKSVHDQTKFSLIGAASVAMWELYSVAAYVVFYYECRKSHGLDDVAAAEVQQNYVYTGLPSGVTAVKVDALY